MNSKLWTKLILGILLIFLLAKLRLAANGFTKSRLILMVLLNATKLVLLPRVSTRNMGLFMRKPSPLLLDLPLFAVYWLLLLLATGSSIKWMSKMLSSMVIFLRRSTCNLHLGLLFPLMRFANYSVPSMASSKHPVLGLLSSVLPFMTSGSPLAPMTLLFLYGLLLMVPLFSFCMWMI
ncbi:hypothetical protein CsSME_00047636 [Camellia sinensis var. sinensis]